jgi:hypothetical protein
MKACSYCGKENAHDATVCAECGTELSLPPQNASPTERRTQLQDILNDDVRLFRALTVTFAATYFVWFLELLVGGQFLPAGTLDALSWDGYRAILPLPERMAWPFFLLNAGVAVGLWRLSKQARLVFTMLTTFSIAMSILGGMHVETPFGSFLAGINSIASGAVLIMAYATPLKTKFT